MSKVYSVMFRVTFNERERIRNIAQFKGYSTVSSFMRSVTLGTPLALELRIADMDQRLRRMEKMLASLCSKFNLSDEITH